MKEKDIYRKAVATFEGGYKKKMDLYIKPEAKDRMRFLDDFEREFVVNFNKEQPHVAHKMINIHF